MTFSWIAWSARQPLERIGALLQVPAMIYLAFQVRSLARGLGALDTAMQAAPSLAFYRASLERLRDYGSGIWLWSRIAVYFPSALLYAYGVALGHRTEGWSAYASFAIVLAALLVCIPLTLPGTRPVVRELQELDRLAREG